MPGVQEKNLDTRPSGFQVISAAKTARGNMIHNFKIYIFLIRIF